MNISFAYEIKLGGKLKAHNHYYEDENHKNESIDLYWNRLDVLQ